jgi:hypothetical protein
MEGLDRPNNNNNPHDPVFLRGPVGGERNLEELDDDDDDDDDDDADEDEEEVDDEEDDQNDNNNHVNNNDAQNNDRDDLNNHNRNINHGNVHADNVDGNENNGVLEGGVAEFYEPLNGHRSSQQADIVSRPLPPTNFDGKDSQDVIGRNNHRLLLLQCCNWIHWNWYFVNEFESLNMQLN